MIYSHKVNVPEILSPDGVTRSPDETKLKSLEKKRATTLEMAQKEDEKKKESAAAEKEVERHHRCPCLVGAWGSQGSSRAPVISMGMIANGFADSLNFQFRGYDD